MWHKGFSLIIDTLTHLWVGVCKVPTDSGANYITIAMGKCCLRDGLPGIKPVNCTCLAEDNTSLG